MAILSEYPDLVKSIFLNKEDNEAGIYGLRFFIRGKPWVVTIDDVIPFIGSESSPSLTYARLADMPAENGAYWGPVLEKGWSKVKGSYILSEGGWVENGIGALLGFPTFTFYSSSMDSTLELWELMKEYDELDYLSGGGTSWWGNSCGIASSHAYSIISVFALRDQSGVIQHRLYMVRNPWATTYYSGNFRSSDSRWTDYFISQVPYGVDPTTSQNHGIFFIPEEDIFSCFVDITVGHNRDSEGFSADWYDFEDDPDAISERSYSVDVPRETGSVYF
mmetsp:Transcript_38563/g.58712  ORF Transcript_38563/g.58712 Transcript_38563/m.58712 type:complete len:277 (+) Transcript_38563:460-1290(+)|eukprot:CAMPEP_0170497748 /NCGR_PEP_ID=MMETSP0208-20121228/25675_1 /TAXON_ID=197538 /ORGANISM="Strombidium inclinatum, Strain S3" /LENGTH=276 /DNA_ID=CAMNT_0010774669 /DNA_START=398 /DNA_END=1228 /DNA_ORIENTATION=-